MCNFALWLFRDVLWIKYQNEVCGSITSGWCQEPFDTPLVYHRIRGRLGCTTITIHDLPPLSMWSRTTRLSTKRVERRITVLKTNVLTFSYPVAGFVVTLHFDELYRFRFLTGILRRGVWGENRCHVFLILNSSNPPVVILTTTWMSFGLNSTPSREIM